MPFGAVSALAIAVALFVRDLERGAKSGRALPMVACAFAILLLVDFKNFPEKSLEAPSASATRISGQLPRRCRALAGRRGH